MSRPSRSRSSSPRSSRSATAPGLTRRMHGGHDAPRRAAGRAPGAASRSRPCSASRSCSSRWCSALQFADWEWVAFALSTPVVFYGGLGFHRLAWRSARHGLATMDTLISLGTLAAWTWSTVVAGWRHLRGHLLRGGRRRDDADPARPLPRGARRRAAPRRRSGRCSSSARRTLSSFATAARSSSPVERAPGRRRVRRSAGREDRDRRRRRRGRVGGRPLDAHR